MDLDTQIITVFCRIDDALKRLLRGKRLRRSGPQAALSDAEVLTIEAVGEFLGLSQDLASTATSDSITAISFQQWPRCVAPPSCARRPTSGGLRSGSGKCSWGPSGMIRP